MIFGWIFDVKMGGLDKLKQAFRIIIVTNMSFWEFWNIEKTDAKIGPKALNISYFGIIGSDFVDFGLFWKKVKMWWISIGKKLVPQIK